MLAGRGSLFFCLISGADPVWSSGHEDPCTARGKAARIAAVAELHDDNAPSARSGHAAPEAALRGARPGSHRWTDPG